MPFSGFGDLNGDFANRLQMFVAASGGRISITSGYRSPERQAQLWQQALAKYGDPEIADNWVARPGKSNHGRGIAVDLGFSTPAAREWAHANAGRFGLHFPMSWEPWHIEPVGSVEQSDRGAYTTPQPGQAHPADNEPDPFDPAVQMERLMGAMIAPAGTMDSPDQAVLESPTVEGPGTEIEQQVNEVGTGVGYGDQQ